MIESKKSNTKPKEKNLGWRPPIWIDKWTDEIVIEELEKMLVTLKENKDIIYIWELFEDKPYSRSSFIHQVKNRENTIELTRVYHTIKELLENRAVKWLLKNELNATWTIFHLKNNYKWVDKHEVDNTNVNTEVESDSMTKEQRKLIAKRFKG